MEINLIRFLNLLMPGQSGEITNPKHSLALLMLRLSAGLSMIVAHGWSKFLKMIAGDANFADPLGIGSQLSLILAASAEFFCSILIIIGLANRSATIPLMITMLVAAFVSNAGETWVYKEKAFLFFIIYLNLFIMGPGKYSIDSYLNRRVKL